MELENKMKVVSELDNCRIIESDLYQYLRGKQDLYYIEIKRTYINKIIRKILNKEYICNIIMSKQGQVLKNIEIMYIMKELKKAYDFYIEQMKKGYKDVKIYYIQTLFEYNIFLSYNEVVCIWIN